MTTTPALQVRHLSASFPGQRGEFRTVLNDISLSVDPGGSLAVVGESGAGKSVLMRSILGVHPLGSAPRVEGSVEIDGVDMLVLSERQRRRMLGRSIAFIHQDPLLSLNPAVRIGVQLTESLAYHGLVRSPQARHAVALEMLRRTRFRDPERDVNKYPHELSGGQRQRVSIAAALISNPSLLIADEPTTALDVTVQRQVLDLLDTLRSERSTALVLVTHDLAVAAQRCEQVAVLRRGQVVETGAAASVISDPRHPYTADLVACTLTLDGPHRSRIELRQSPGGQR